MDARFNTEVTAKKITIRNVICEAGVLRREDKTSSRSRT